MSFVHEVGSSTSTKNKKDKKVLLSSEEALSITSSHWVTKSKKRT